MKKATGTLSLDSAKTTPPTKDELQIALSMSEDIPSINIKNLRETAKRILEKKPPAVGFKEFYTDTVIAGNYENFDLDKHGLPNLLDDLWTLIKFYNSGVNTVRSSIANPTGNAFVMGCGSGRLAIPYIELSQEKHLNMKRIVFNDLVSGYLEQTREKIADLYNTRKQEIGGVKIDFIQGDFLEISQKLRQKFDIMFAMWFVTSEIADFSSIEKLRKTREELFLKVKNILINKGVFVEDVPFTEGAGAYYYLAQLISYVVLDEMNKLKGENENIILTNFSDIQETGFPHHMRYAPQNGKHRSELEKAGFTESDVHVVTLPSAIIKPDKLQRLLSNENILQLFQKNDISYLLTHLNTQKYLLTYPNDNAPEAQRKKIRLLQNNGN